MRKLNFAVFGVLSVLLSFVSGAMCQNSLLAQLAKEDQDSRKRIKIAKTDEERIKIVLSLIGPRSTEKPPTPNAQRTASPR